MKRYLVTGCSRGIGRAVTEMLLADGHYVIGISRTFPNLAHENFRWHPADVRTQGLGHLTDHLVLAGVTQLDGLVHAAGIRGPHAHLDRVDPEQWIGALSVNLVGAFRVVHTLLPYLLKADDARILLFSGGGAFNPSPGYSAYAASKAGVVSMMETLAAELSETRVTVNCVAPGPVPTTIHAPAALPDDGGKAMNTAVACIRHLLSEDARGLTGKTVSASWDKWERISADTVALVNESPEGQRDRHLITVSSLQDRPCDGCGRPLFVKAGGRKRAEHIKAWCDRPGCGAAAKHREWQREYYKTAGAREKRHQRYLNSKAKEGAGVEA